MFAPDFIKDFNVLLFVLGHVGEAYRVLPIEATWKHDPVKSRELLVAALNSKSSCLRVPPSAWLYDFALAKQTMTGANYPEDDHLSAWAIACHGDLGLLAQLAAQAENLMHRYPILGEILRLSPSERTAWQKILRANDIEVVTRFHSLAQLERVIEDRSPKLGDTRPVVTILESREEHNGYLDQETHPFVHALARRYRIIYHECATPEIEVAKAREAASAGPVDLLICLAHSVPDSVWLGGEDLRLSQSEQIRAIAQTVKASGKIILAGCHTGEGRASTPNFVNAFAVANPGCEVMGYPNENFSYLDVDSEGLVSGIHLYDGALPYVTRFRPIAAARH